MTLRREFLAQIGGMVTAASLDTRRLDAMASQQSPEWDMSWVDRIMAAKYRVVFNAHAIDDGEAMYSAALVLNQFHEVYGTDDKQTCPAIIFRSAGTPMAFNDSIWERYGVGDRTKVTDPITKAPAKRNIFLKADEGANAQAAAAKIAALQQRGLVCLVCNRAMHGFAYEIAEESHKSADSVYADIRANLIPGAYVVPSGIFALVRAQNAGCAYMTVS